MKVKLLSAIIAATFLAGCSSSGSDSDTETPNGVASVEVFNGENFDGMVIQGDEGEYNTVAIQGAEGNTVFNVGGELYYTNGTEVMNKDGDVVGVIEVVDNQLMFVGPAGYVHLSVEDGRLIVNEKGAANPENPIVSDPDYDAGVIPTYGDIVDLGGAAMIVGDNDNVAIVSKDNDGNVHIVINDEENHYTVENGTVKDPEGNTIGSVEQDGDNFVITLNSGTQFVVRNEDGRLFAAIIERPDVSHPIEGVPMLPIEIGPVHPIEDVTPVNPIEGPVTLPSGELTQEQRAELKQKVQSLSQEQRQEIKRAIRDRVERS
ncbi:hypothetical protein [Vibrio owensii]|uniref:hypothetical protein n=1 Tax=Vibrio owensii TaxID=696485 RepID=UPI0038CD5A55